MIINYTIAGNGAPAGFATAVAAAVQYFETTLTNTVTVNLTFTWGPLSNGIVGETDFGSNFGNVSYASWRAALLANASASGADADNLTAAQALPATDPLGNGKVVVSYPYASAIGLAIPGETSDPAATDATITLSSALSYTFDPAHRTVAGDYDAIAALEHEISEALGRIAGSDGYDPGSSKAASTISKPNPLDFFRYANGTGALDTSTSYANASFSLTGATNLIQMGEEGGDLSDWGTSVTGDLVGYAYSSIPETFTAVDLQAMAAIGWHIAPATALDITAGDDSFSPSGAAVTVIDGLPGLSITGNGNTLAFGTGDTALVTGNNNQITISGSSSTITVAGSGNTVAMNAIADQVTLTGSGNAGGSGDVVNVAAGSGDVYLGDDSTITVTGPFANIVVGGNDHATIETMSGGLTIGGSGTTATLTGNLSVVFQAAGSTVETADGSQVTVQGDGDTINAGNNETVNLTNVAGGTGDLLTVTGTGTAVKVANFRFLNQAETIDFQAGGQVTVYGDSMVVVNGNGVSAQVGVNDDVTLNGSGATVAVAGTGSTIALTQGGTVIVAAGSQVAVTGPGVTASLAASGTLALAGGNGVVNAGGGDAVTLSNTAGAWDSVSGSGAALTLSGAQSAVIGGANTIGFDAGTTGNVAGLYATAGSWDQITGSGGTIYLTGAQAAILGAGNAVSFAGGTGNAAGLYDTTGTWDSVWAPGGDTVYLTNAQAAIAGGGDAISFAGGTGNIAGLYATGGAWDSVWAPDGDTIYLTSAQAAITGGGNAISFAGGSGNIAGLYDTGTTADTVWAPGGDTIYLTSAQATITGGGNVIGFAGGTGNVATITDTAGAWDSAWASNGTLNLHSAQVAITGSGDTIGFAGGNTASLNGANQTLAFQQGIGGQDVINGFAATDTIQLSATDFSSWAYLLNSGAMAQVGADTVITLDAADTIRLTGVTASSLGSAQFRFA
ncbi:NF038122 family metalloprotease [Novosphingobium sp.]|uniref:NF038122 family metalloprotease n=1 Tax=Novosphingobium sp. TaxID=1874826 RepID=UPI003B52BDBE